VGFHCFGHSHVDRKVFGVFSAVYPPEQHPCPSMTTPLTDKSGQKSLFSYHYLDRNNGVLADNVDKIDRFSVDIAYMTQH
jgi:hypothetical protein